MRKFIRITYIPEHIDLVLLIVRVCIACFMMAHGFPKLSKFFSDEQVEFADPIGVGVVLSLALTVFAEVICSAFIFIGLFTRLAVIPLMITMLVAAFIVHGNDGFSKMEPSLLYLVIYILLIIAGSGKYSIDRLLDRHKEEQQ
jgi:putative oxidoreductase